MRNIFASIQRIINKNMVWNDRELHLEEFMQLDEAIRPNRGFGLNAPKFNDGKVLYDYNSAFAFKEVQGTVFALVMDGEDTFAFGPVHGYAEGDSVEEMLGKVQFGKAKDLDQRKFALLLGSVMGFIIQFFKDKNPSKVSFTGLDKRLESLYNRLLQAEVTKKELHANGLTVVRQDMKFVITKEN